MALTVAQSRGRSISFPGVIRAGVKLGPALKGPIRYTESRFAAHESLDFGNCRLCTFNLYVNLTSSQGNCAF